MICDAFDIVVVPFPFVDKPESKKRPALVLSNVEFNAEGHSILAMITTRHKPTWPGDIQITDLASCGLRTSCIIRFKLFTLDNRLILKRIGKLGKADSLQVTSHLKAVFAF